MKRTALYRYKNKVRKMMREINTALYNDNKLLGRFVISMKSFSSVKFEDNSGWNVWFSFTLWDKQHNQMYDIFLDTYCGNNKYAENNVLALRFLASKLWTNINQIICNLNIKEGIMKKDYIPIDYRCR